MIFYRAEDCSNVSATWIGKNNQNQGILTVEVEGQTPNLATTIQLIKDYSFNDGLKIDVMGCTGSFAGQIKPYKVSNTFRAKFTEKIIISCAEADHVIRVKKIVTD